MEKSESTIMIDHPFFTTLSDFLREHLEEIKELDKLDEGYHVVAKDDGYYYDLCLKKIKIPKD